MKACGDVTTSRCFVNGEFVFDNKPTMCCMYGLDGNCYEPDSCVYKLQYILLPHKKQMRAERPVRLG